MALTTVNELINQDERTWKEDIINSSFDRVTATAILKIHLSKDEPDKEDELISTKTPSGKFSTKYVYKLIVDEARSTSRSQEEETKSFWQNFGS